MELGMKTEKLDIIKKLWEASLTQEETTELIVPDTQPDIDRIISADARVLLKSKESDTGRATVKSSVVATVIYCDGNGDFYSLETNIPVTVSSENPDILPDCMMICHMEATSADAVAANSRKMIVRVSLKTEIRCYNYEYINLCRGFDEEVKGTYIHESSVEKLVQTQVTEKTFLVSDDLKIPSDAPAVGEVLNANVRICDVEHTVTGEKLVIRGKYESEICYVPESGERAVIKNFSTEFSQLVDIEAGSEDVFCDVDIMMTNCYVDFHSYSQEDESRVIALEIHGVAQCAVFEKKSVPYVDDAYSVSGTLSLTSEEIPTAEYRQYSYSEMTFSGEIPCQAEVGEIFKISAFPGEIEYMENDGKISVYVQAVIFDREWQSYVVRGTVYGSADIAEHTSVSFASIDVSGEISDGKISVSGRAVLKMCDVHTETLTVINGAALEAPETEEQRPSVTIYRVRENDSLWGICKRFRSDCEGLKTANGIDGEDALEPGYILLIPKG